MLSESSNKANYGRATAQVVSRRPLTAEAQMKYEFGERRWNDIFTWENRRTRRKTCPSDTSSTTNPTWIDPGVIPDVRGERASIYHLSYGTAN
jgi:hypothetical protein